MKKVIISTFIITVFLTGCSKEEGLTNTDASLQYIEVNMNNGIITRGNDTPLPAGVDPDQYHWRYALEVIDVNNNNTRLYYIIQTDPVFDVRLPRNKVYDFYAWVDIVKNNPDKTSTNDYFYKINHPEDSLSLVLMEGQSYSNSPVRNAYMGKGQLNLISNPDQTTVNLTVRRPFAQINIITTDMADIITHNTHLENREMPYEVDVYYDNLYYDFNARAESSGNYQKTFIPKVISTGYTGTLIPAESSTSGLLTSDLVFATSGSTRLINITIQIYTKDYYIYPAEGDPIHQGRILLSEKRLTNIPVRRNCQTNIRGRLIMGGGIIQVEVTPTFDSNQNINI